MSPSSRPRSSQSRSTVRSGQLCRSIASSKLFDFFSSLWQSCHVSYINFENKECRFIVLSHYIFPKKICYSITLIFNSQKWIKANVHLPKGFFTVGLSEESDISYWSIIQVLEMSFFSMSSFYFFFIIVSTTKIHLTILYQSWKRRESYIENSRHISNDSLDFLLYQHIIPRF